MVLITSSDRNFRCCFSLHVRTGTIILGAVQIILHLVALAFLIAITIQPMLFYSHETKIGPGGQKITETVYDQRPYLAFVMLIPTVSDPHISSPWMNSPPHPRGGGGDIDEKGSKVDGVRKKFAKFDATNLNIDFTDHDSPFNDSSSSTEKQLSRRRHPYFSFSILLFSLAFCCLLVHGAYYYQPAQLLPYFFLQVFDFIVNLLTVIGSLSSTSSDGRFHRSSNLPHKMDVHQHQPATPLFAAIFALSTFCLLLTVKAYCMCMVWDCYRYLVLMNTSRHHSGTAATRSGRRLMWWSLFGLDSSSIDNDRRRRDDILSPTPPVYDQSMDLPKYEDALGIPANLYAPPPYYAATINTPTARQSSSTAVTTSNDETTGQQPSDDVRVALPQSNTQTSDAHRAAGDGSA